MLTILKGENLKYKHTLTKKIIWICPLSMLLIAFVINAMYFYGCAVNWWYGFFFPIQVALMGSLFHQKEAKKLNYMSVYIMPIDLGRTWWGKCLLAALYLLVSAVALGIGVSLVSLGWKGTVENGVGGTLLAVVVVGILHLWQFPLYFWIAKKTNFYVPFMVSIVGIVLSFCFATRSSWWLVPFAWTNRLMCYVIGYMPNGLPVTKEYEWLLLSPTVVAITIALASLLFVLTTCLTAILFKREVK